MASGDVKIVVSAEDKATATLRQIQAEMEKFSGTASKLAKGAVAYITTDRIIDFAKSSVMEFAKAEQAQIKLQSVLRATGNTTKLTQQQIEVFAQSVQNATGTEAEEVLDAASQLGRMSGIAGEQFKEILSLANDMKTVLGGDMTSAAMMLAKALNDPVEGMSKLARSGVSFTETQKEIIKNLDEQGKKAEAQAEILKEVRRQFGGASDDFGNTVAGNISKLSNAIGDLQEVIGEALAPEIRAITHMIQGLTGSDVISQSKKTRERGVGRNVNPADELADIDRQNMVLQGQLSKLQKKRNERGNSNSAFVEDALWWSLSPLFGTETGDQALEREMKAVKQRQMELMQRRNEIEAAAQQQIQARKTTSFFGSAISDLGGGVFRGFGDMFGRLTTGTNVAGVQIPSTVELGASLMLNKALGQWSPYAIQQAQQEKREAERRDNLPALAATEARFLQRGRGLLDPAAAAANKQVALLERIDSTLRRIENGDVILAAEAIG